MGRRTALRDGHREAGKSIQHRFRGVQMQLRARRRSLGGRANFLSLGDSRMRSWLAALGGWVALALLLLRSLSVDIFAVVTNDSLIYVGSAHAPFAEGWVLQGYRQVGYPAFLWFIDIVRDWFSWDRLFAIALAQRTLLVLSVLVIWRLLKWWSVPLLLFATIPTIVVLSNFVLTEGWSTPLALFFSALIASLVVTHDASGIRLTVVGSLAGTALVFLAATKLQFAAYGPLLAAALLLGGTRRRLSRRAVLAMVGVPAVAIASLAVVQSLENYEELGVLEPVSERARAEWYGAYQAIFHVPAEVSIGPALEPFYDDHDLYAFLHGLEAEEPDYLVRRRVIDARIESMFAAAATDASSQRWAAILGALRGGRTDDVQGLVNLALEVTPRTLERAYTVNGLAKTEGPGALLRQVNESRIPSILETSALAPAVGGVLDDHRPLRAWASVGALVVTVAGTILAGKLRWVAAASLLGTVAIAVALGLSYIDNGRHLVPGILISATVATLVVRDRCTSVLGAAGRSQPSL